jgi:purine-nucleoside phosphorylase
MTVHIGAAPGDIADVVLMPGDPYRARWAAQAFLEDVRLVNEVRGMLGYTGTWNGHRVTFQGSGMGMPSLSIYVNELIRDYGVKTIVRIGSCGGMQPHVRMRDLVIAMTASAVSTPPLTILRELNFAPSADWGLLSAAVRAAGSAKVGVHVGGIYSTDVFYGEREDLTAELIRHGVLGVEMEAAELYTLALRHGIRALAILTVSDHLLTHESLAASEREQSFGEMVEIALQAACA